MCVLCVQSVRRGTHENLALSDPEILTGVYVCVILCCLYVSLCCVYVFLTFKFVCKSDELEVHLLVYWSVFRLFRSLCEFTGSRTKFFTILPAEL